MRHLYAVVTLAALAIGGCGSSSSAVRPINVACVVHNARGDASVQTLETKPPAQLGTATGYVRVRLKEGVIVTVTRWPNAAAARAAAQSFKALAVRLAASSTRIEQRASTVIIAAPRAAAGESALLKGCE